MSRQVLAIFLIIGINAAIAQQPSCNATAFNLCQTAFANALSISPNDNWNNPLSLTIDLQNIYINGLGAQNGLVAVCNAYNNQLIQCLGAQAPACINAYYLLGHDNTPINAYSYASLMNMIQFQCGAGFYPAFDNWGCIQRVYQHFNATLYTTIFTFLLHAQSNPASACQYLSTALTDYAAPFRSTCGNTPQWYACESMRVYLMTQYYACPAMCQVSNFGMG